MSAVGAVVGASVFDSGAATHKGQMVGLTVLDQLGTIACAVFRAALGAPGTSEQSNVPSLMGQNSKERDTSGYLIMELPINVS